MSLILPCLPSPFGDRAPSEAGSRSGGRARDPHGPGSHCYPVHNSEFMFRCLVG